MKKDFFYKVVGNVLFFVLFFNVKRLKFELDLERF